MRVGVGEGVGCYEVCERNRTQKTSTDIPACPSYHGKLKNNSRMLKNERPYIAKIDNLKIRIFL